jgi:hypothetical protein
MKSILDFTRSPLALPLAKLGGLFRSHGRQPPAASRKPLYEWKMEIDDAPIFRFVYESHQPRRHLEFGTWQGAGTVLCLESCNATVWTINLPDGETKADGSWAYGERVTGAATKSTSDIVAEYHGEDEYGPQIFHRTDAGAYIGKLYREKRLGHRVCQIYCDSRHWDCSNYPADFFDSVLVDGGHELDAVISDTRKAFQVLRSGGIIMWHDFCPSPEVRAQCESVKGVTAAIESMAPELGLLTKTMCWIKPSWILLGIKK